MTIEPRSYPDPPPPDRDAIVVRGVCGVLLGIGVGAILWIRLGGLGPAASILLFMITVAGCAWGSVRHGDSFWVAVLRRRR